jgi:hypothetical protein
MGDAVDHQRVQLTFIKTIRRLDRAGVLEPGLAFHGLRHTVGTMLTEAGCDIDTDVGDGDGDPPFGDCGHVEPDAGDDRQARAQIENTIV